MNKRQQRKNENEKTDKEGSIRRMNTEDSQ